MADIIQIRRDTAANWTSTDPTLANGEWGYETDTGKLKIGDGVTAWTSLAYFNTTPLAHTLGGASHTADTLANLNTKISDATLREWEDDQGGTDIHDNNIAQSSVTQHEAALSITESQISDLDHDDTDAIHDNVANEIHAIALKATPVSADEVVIEDSADSWNKKRASVGSIASGSDTKKVMVSGADASEDYLENKVTTGVGSNVGFPLEANNLDTGGGVLTRRIQFDNSRVDHDSCANFDSNEHIDHTSVDLTISGTTNEVDVSGGAQDISASRTWTVGLADDFEAPGTGGMTPPTGTQAQRPGVPNVGEMRVNSDDVKLEIYEGGWNNVAWDKGAFHDTFSDYVAAEHIDWSATGAEDIHDDRIAAGTVTQHEGSIDHDSLTNTHNLTTDIDHNSLTNTHNLTSDIDHDQTTNFVAEEHIRWDQTGAEDVHADRIAAGAVTQHEGSINHANLTNGHDLTTDIDHDTITNSHNLTSDIDHDTITNAHNLTTDIDHTAISNIGSNSHATIDSHLGATAAHGATGAVVGTTNTQTLTNKTLQLDAEAIVMTAYNNTGASRSKGDLCYIDGDQSGTPRMALADADAESTAGPVMLVMVNETIGSANSGEVVVFGWVTGLSGLTAGAEQYVSTTAGAITETAPSGASDVIRVVGYAMSTTEIFFEPSGSWVVHS